MSLTYLTNYPASWGAYNTYSSNYYLSNTNLGYSTGWYPPSMHFCNRCEPVFVYKSTTVGFSVFNLPLQTSEKKDNIVISEEKDRTHSWEMLSYFGYNVPGEMQCKKCSMKKRICAKCGSWHGEDLSCDEKIIKNIIG